MSYKSSVTCGGCVATGVAVADARWCVALQAGMFRWYTSFCSTGRRTRRTRADTSRHVPTHHCGALLAALRHKRCTPGLSRSMEDTVPDHLLENILVRCANALDAPARVNARWMRVCTRPRVMAASLIARLGGELALIRACDHAKPCVVRALLECPLAGAPRADFRQGWALGRAALNCNGAFSPYTMLLPSMLESSDNEEEEDEFTAQVNPDAEECMRVLLEWHEHAPRADCAGGGGALVAALMARAPDRVRLLLEWPEYAPRADCWGGAALYVAASNGDLVSLQLLLDSTPHMSYQLIESALSNAQDSPAICDALMKYMARYHPRMREC